MHKTELKGKGVN